MKKMTMCVALTVLLSSLLAGCGHTHEWVDANCETPKTCPRCGETEGAVLGHQWENATCITPKTCSRCSATEGAALGHQAGDWIIASEPQNGNAGVKTRSCYICNETVESKEFLYSYFDMSFEEFVKQHNKTYSEFNWTIRKVDTGFSFFMDSTDETAIIFHSDMNGKKSGTATAYDTNKLEKFNVLQIRIIDHGAKFVDNELMPDVLMLGAAITQPLGGYELSAFCEKFVDKWIVTSSSQSRVEGEAVIGDYKYTLRAYVDRGYSTRVFYEWICQTI